MPQLQWPALELSRSKCNLPQEKHRGEESNDTCISLPVRHFVHRGALSSVAYAQHALVDDKELMTKLKAAAPANVLEHATVVNMGADGKMKVIQQSSSGWTCTDPGGAPMCADKAAMEWAESWQSKGPAPQKRGIDLTCRSGDNGASNTDPYATKETPDNNWVKTGSHVMIVGAEAKGMLQGYPRDAKADPTRPYVMWPGSPYEHLMLPTT